MNPTTLRAYRNPPLNIDAAAGMILEVQKKSGEIPWNQDGKTDHWDHVEAAMGLSVAGYYTEARRAFAWSKEKQLRDGAYFGEYLRGEPVDKRKDANMSAYIAVGVLHYYLITSDHKFLEEMWETVESAIEFAVGLQAETGEIFWAVSPDGETDRMALLTGSSSVFMSLKCAIAIAKILGKKKPAWKRALRSLGNAIRNKPHHFNMTKARYSMDWFYPILSGAITGIDARKRIDRSWKKFVVEGHGVKCVSDEPWITIAETSELCLSLCAYGAETLAGIVFEWISDKRFDDGSFYCGYTVPDGVVWPEEKTAWTNAVVLMAADAIYSLTPASNLFDHDFWSRFRLF